MRIDSLRERLGQGLVIPAHPLALGADRKLSERHQRALTRYYLAAGAGGVAVGVHTTQFEIHEPTVGLYEPVLELAAEEVRRTAAPTVLVAGIIGDTDNAVREAALARELGYHCGLVSLAAMREGADSQLVDHCRTIAEVLPVMGFYLQPAVGGRRLGYEFWREFAEIPGVVAIKIAPFNRYQTLEVLRAVVEAGREQEISLYTGNDDNILLDLLTPYCFRRRDREVKVSIVGGLLGQWAVWTRRACELMGRVRHLSRDADPIPRDLLTLNVQLTDANGAIFDQKNHFSGCIPGIHEVLRRQGLLQGTWCLNPREQLSPGQTGEIDRVCWAYPGLTDDEFVAQHLEDWLSG